MKPFEIYQLLDLIILDIIHVGFGGIEGLDLLGGNIDSYNLEPDPSEFHCQRQADIPHADYRNHRRTVLYLSLEPIGLVLAR
jgi:hypothetical protein